MKMIVQDKVNYMEILAKVYDAEMRFKDEESVNMEPILYLVLQEVKTGKLFAVTLEDKDLEKLIGMRLNTKQIIDFASALRLRDEPVRIILPENSEEISVKDIQRQEVKKAQNTPFNKNYKNRRRKKNGNNSNRKPRNGNNSQRTN